MKFTKTLIIIVFAACGLAIFSCQPKPALKVLVFSKTAGFRHDCIKKGVKTLKKLGEENQFYVEATEDASVFEQKNLKDYQVVIFLNTTGDVLNDAQQLEFQRYMQAGGNYVGVHAAADTEYEWDWYGRLVGGYFKSHPKIQKASIDVLVDGHPATSHLPKRWETTDEWYNYFNLSEETDILMNLDESSYEGGENGENHPIAWCHEYSGGRAFYTGLGHTKEQYENEDFLKHLLGGIMWAVGNQKLPDYSLKTVAPEENRFKKVVLADNFEEPMEMEILPDESILFIERRGRVKRYIPETEKVETIHLMDVYTEFEDGLLGMALDPNFEENNWIYFYYSHPTDTFQQLSRFTMTKDFMSIAENSEKQLLKVKTQRKECCHAGGSIEFDAKDNLFLSTGDNTNPFASQGYSPSDERAGREPWDAQRTSANSMDLRGKVLRITPQNDGSYTIPEGNLFSEKEKGLPEIYVMGCRNPFRISIDQHTGYLYWGDVGPDAARDSSHRGARGHDEVNQARQAGFFGWPLFIANNKAYHEFDFQKRATLEKYDASKPINNSPNNTGVKELPPAQPAFIWYPYAKSDEFPLVKEGGRNAMAGEVFYQADYKKNPRRFPAYFDKKLFTYDWIRGWIMTITMNENGDYKEMERFMPSHRFDNPIDMKFSVNGELYVLEYGRSWYSRNKDARLSRIEYTGDNRQPIAKLEVDKTVGGLPLTVNFDASESLDFDGEDLTFSWSIDGEAVENMESTFKHTFEKAGTYKVEVTVTDPYRNKNTFAIDVVVGNELASVDWVLNGNQTFFWKNRPLEYSINVVDKEDGELGSGIKEEDVMVTIDYLAEGKDIVQASIGHQVVVEPTGKALMDNSDCRACHQLNEKSNGPTYLQIADKYKSDKNALNYLATKIINGGSGIWGEVAMAAHPNISLSDAEMIADYILSLNKKKETLPAKGKYQFAKHKPTDWEGKYILKASYQDKGANEIPSFKSEKTIILRQPILTADDYTELEKTQQYEIKAGSSPEIKEDVRILNGNHEGYIKFSQLDMTDVKSLRLVYGVHPAYFVGGAFEIRLDTPDGKLLATANAQPSEESRQIFQSKISADNDVHDVYVVFKSSDPEAVKGVGTFLQLHFLN